MNPGVKPDRQIYITPYPVPLPVNLGVKPDRQTLYHTLSSTATSETKRQTRQTDIISHPCKYHYQWTQASNQTERHYITTLQVPLPVNLGVKQTDRHYITPLPVPLPVNPGVKPNRQTLFNTLSSTTTSEPRRHTRQTDIISQPIKYHYQWTQVSNQTVIVTHPCQYHNWRTQALNQTDRHYVTPLPVSLPVNPDAKPDRQTLCHTLASIPTSEPKSQARQTIIVTHPCQYLYRWTQAINQRDHTTKECSAGGSLRDRGISRSTAWSHVSDCLPGRRPHKDNTVQSAKYH